MKIYYKFIFAFVLLTNTVYGQSHLGVFGGLNFGRFSGDVPVDAYYYSLPGFNGGVNFDISLSKIIDLSLQPSFTQEGTTIYYNVRGESKLVDSIGIRLNYFALPVLLKVQSTNKHFYALGGFEAGYLLSKSILSHGNELDADLEISSFNVSAQFGAGYRIFLGLPRLYIELRYAQGIINLTDEPIEKSYIPRVKTNGFKLLVGIEIPLGKTSKQ